MQKVYHFLVQSDVALKDFKKAVFTERLLWLPNVDPAEHSPNTETQILGQFFIGKALRQHDNTGLVDRCAYFASFDFLLLNFFANA
jgi:hypothetical protein